MNIKGQGHSLTLVQDHSDSTVSFFFVFFFFSLSHLETAWPIEAKFYVEPPWDKGTKVWSNGLYHMTKLAAMPIYGKNLKQNLLLCNQKVNDHENWYVALGTRVLPS